MRVALRNDSYALHLLLPTKVDPLVSLMKVEKVPDSTYDMVGGLDRQIKVRLLKFWELFGREGQRERERVEEEGEQETKKLTLSRVSSRSKKTKKTSFFKKKTSPLPTGDQGGHRAPDQAPGALRRPGSGAAQGRPALWSSGDREDPARPRRRPPHRLHFHSRFGIRISAKVHRRGVEDGQGTVRDGEGARAVDHLHGRGTRDGEREREREKGKKKKNGKKKFGFFFFRPRSHAPRKTKNNNNKKNRSTPSARPAAAPAAAAATPRSSARCSSC